MTNDKFLEAGLSELALLYFSSPQKKLCILDREIFDSVFSLFEYLLYLEKLSDELNVLVINESLPNNPDKRFCPWICGPEISVNAFIHRLNNSAKVKSNIKDVADFYAANMKRWRFSFIQTTIIDYLIKGMTVKEIAHILNTSPKTVYSSVRKVCINHNKRSLIQLVHYLCVNKSSFTFFKHPLAGRTQF
ncbi:helix-turn-helix transcriptional regulator [Enterobacter bugandensis]